MDKKETIIKIDIKMYKDNIRIDLKIKKLVKKLNFLLIELKIKLK